MSYRPAPRPQPDASPSPRAPPLSTQWWAGCAGGAAPAKGDPDSPPPSSRSCKRRCGGWSLLSPSLVGSVREDGKRSDRRHRPESRPSSGGCGPPPTPVRSPRKLPKPCVPRPKPVLQLGGHRTACRPANPAPGPTAAHLRNHKSRPHLWLHPPSLQIGLAEENTRPDRGNRGPERWEAAGGRGGGRVRPTPRRLRHGSLKRVTNHGHVKVTPTGVALAH